MEGVSIHRQRIDWHTGFRAGWVSIGLGVAVHYASALTWTAIFLGAATKIVLLTRRPILSGLVYGLVVYLLMNFLLLPLSGVPHTRNAITFASRINAVLALLLSVGLTISLMTRTALRRT